VTGQRPKIQGFVGAEAAEDRVFGGAVMQVEIPRNRTWLRRKSICLSQLFAVETMGVGRMRACDVVVEVSGKVQTIEEGMRGAEKLSVGEESANDLHLAGRRHEAATVERQG
jgi:hypothetical protein